MQYKSMADELYGLTDSRCIYLEIQYHDMDLETLKSCALKLISFMQELHGQDFVAKWTFDDRSISEKRLIEKIERADDNFDFWSEGNVITPYVYDKRTLNAFEKTLKYDWTIPRSRCSDDYYDFVDRLFAQNDLTDASLGEAVMRLFREPNRINVSYYNMFDLQAHCFSSKYWHKPGRYHGTIVVEIAAGCVQGHEQSISEVFYEFAKACCQEFDTANGRVGIAPWPTGIERSPYMKYFGVGKVTGDGSHAEMSCEPIEWYPYYYLCGAEWGNIISALTQKHLSKLREEAKNCDEVMYEELSNGSVSLRLHKPINSIDVQDLYVLRHMLNDSLFRGESRKYDLKKLVAHEDCFLPRGGWELVPIYESDIVVEDGILTFHKQMTDS